jgi:hypothetical protein
MRSDIDTALEEIRVTQNRDPTAAEVLDAEARAARLLQAAMADATQPTHTGIPISEFLAGRGEPPPPPPPAHTGIPISEFLAGRGAAPTTTMPGPSPGTEAALARGMEAVRVGVSTAARPHGGIHISEFLRRHEGPAGVAAGARVPADAVRRMLESLESPDGSVDAGQLVARIVEMSREGGDTCEYRMDDGNDGDY